MVEQTLQRRTFSAARLDEGLGQDYESWQVPRDRQWATRSPTRAFIQSPAGTGKLAFIRDTLLPYAGRMGRNILLLTDRPLGAGTRRGVLRLQPPNDSAGAVELPVEILGAPAGSGKLMALGYETLREMLRTGLPYELYSVQGTVFYVALDQAHRLLEEAPFDPWTGEMVAFVCRLFPRSVQVYLSAALEEAMVPLLALVRRWDTQQTQQRMVDEELYRQDARFYHNEPAVPRQTPVFYRRLEEIAAAVSEDETEDKWLVFVSAKEAGRELVRRINEVRRSGAVFLSAASRSGAAWQRLEREGTFREKVLVTTRALVDCVELRDRSLRHVVLPAGSQTELLSMLACRPDGEAPASVYVQFPDDPYVTKQIFQLQRKLAVIDEVMRGGKEVNRRLLQRYWLQGDPGINRLFTIDALFRLTPNPLAREKLSGNLALYQTLREHGGDPDCYSGLVCRWLGTEACCRRLGQSEGFDTLEELLARCQGRPIPPEEQEAFYNDFLLCYQRCGGEPLRRAAGRHKATVNQGLAALGSPYRLGKRGGAWFLERTEQDPAGENPTIPSEKM